jgi:hypothetical protein
MRFTGAKTKRDAVPKALNDFNRRMAALVRHSRSFTDFPSLESLRKTEAGRDKLTDAR